MKIKIPKTYETEPEHKSIVEFLKFYVRKYGISIDEIDIRVPDSEGEQGQPDYFIKQLGILAEVKRVFDRAEQEVTIQWSRSKNKLRDYIYDNYKKDIPGYFLITVPKDIKIKGNKHVEIAKLILNAINKHEDVINISNIGTFEIKKVKNEGNYIFFMSSAEAKIIDSPHVIYENLASKIAVANRQLGAYKEKEVNKRILLVVNRYIFGENKREFVEALTYSYEDLLNYKNIDEIWLQFQYDDEQWEHSLIYTSNFLQRFNNQEVTEGKEFVELFLNWFTPLKNKGDEFKEKCFYTVKYLLKNRRPHERFEDPNIREEIISLAEWYAKNDRINEVIWVIDKFIDDPDPGDPDLYDGPPESDYHQIIKEGKDTQVITSVLGHLAWLIRYLTTKKENIEKALNYTKILINHKNLIAKFNAIAPLIEIASRRQWLKGYGIRPRISEYKEFHNLVFRIVRLIEENPNYKNIAEFLIRVFSYYKDLSTKEVIEVLNSMKIIDHSSGLFIYFGIYRKNHFKDMNIEYNAEKINNMLIEVIKSQDHQDIRAKIAHHFWRILADKKKDYTIIKPYLNMLFNTPYHNNTYTILEYVIKDWIEVKPLQCTKWYINFLREIDRYFEHESNMNLEISVWLHDTENIIVNIAHKEPKYLLMTVMLLIQLWRKKIYIGDWKKVILSYSFVPNDKLKEKYKRDFSDIYNGMKSEYPDLEKIIFD